MTYRNAIQELVNKAGNELTYPINIYVYYLSANNIQLELDEGRSINEILDDKIHNIDDISINWLNNRNRISTTNFNDYEVTNEFYLDSDESTEKIFNYNKQQFIQIDEDVKFRLLLHPLSQTVEFEENGFLKQKILDYEKYDYVLEHVILPKFKDYKYKSLYSYDKEEDFTNAILLQFILRHIQYNNFAPDEIKSFLPEEENIYEKELKAQVEFKKIKDELNKKLKNIFGLTYNEVTNLKFMYHKYYLDSLEEDNIDFKLKSIPSFVKNIEINLTDSKEKLIDQIEKTKDVFDKEKKSCLNLKEKVSDEYLDKVNNVLKKFPKSFKKKKDHLIKSLFIFDYIKAKKLETERLNNEILQENQIDIKEIEEVYANDLNKKKQKLSENEKKFKNNMIRYPKMNLDKEKSIFLEIGKLISEQPGQAKKLHSHIHKFLEQKF